MVTTAGDIHASARKNLIRLSGSIQNYEWGKQGSQSLVARPGGNATGGHLKVDESKCYAEVCENHKHEFP